MTASPVRFPCSKEQSLFQGISDDSGVRGYCTAGTRQGLHPGSRVWVELSPACEWASDFLLRAPASPLRTMGHSSPMANTV